MCQSQRVFYRKYTYFMNDLDYVHTRAKVSRLITFRIFGFTRRLHYRGVGFVGIRIQCFHFKFRIQKFPDSSRNRKVLIPDSCFVCKRQNESGTKTFRIREHLLQCNRSLRKVNFVENTFFTREGDRFVIKRVYQP